jgi:hypothetical protein
MRGAHDNRAQAYYRSITTCENHRRGGGISWSTQYVEQRSTHTL